MVRVLLEARSRSCMVVVVCTLGGLIGGYDGRSVVL